MAKNLIISILAAFFVTTIVSRADAASSKRAKPLIDGFVLTGVDGKLTGADSKWFFEFDSDVSDDKGRIFAGTNLELLPSATLEKMTADAKRRYIGAAASYRLWGRVTKYRGKNFIFSIYFLPLSETKKPKFQTSQKSQQQETKIPINEPNDTLIIPEEIIAKLATRRTVRPQQLRKGLEMKQDSILADRTGFIRDSGHEVSFVLDAFGRNFQQVKLNLLPCEALERAQRRQSAEPDPLRFKIAGIVTKCKGEYYLLLQRATRVYSYGNFGR